jgi:hypothetical protein
VIAAPALPPPPIPLVRAALAHRLRGQHLSVRWVHCFRDPKTYRGHRVTRCKVDFGDPHIVQYCVVLLRGGLVTDHERRAIRCGLHPDPQLGRSRP